MVERRQRDVPVPVDRRRGRPPGPAPMVVVLKLRVTAEQRDRITAIASLNSLGRSAFIRQAINDAAADCTDDPIFSA
jgi:hypothetical protein